VTADQSFVVVAGGALVGLFLVGRVISWAAKVGQPPKRQHSAKYLNYMKSREWDAKRAQVRRRAGGKCEECRRRKTLQVHHLTYARLGNEDMADLMALCLDCHQGRHGHQITSRRAGCPLAVLCLLVGLSALVAVLHAA